MLLKIVIVGATSGIAEQCARLWLARAPHQLALVGRDTARLERVAADLRVRAPAAAISVETCDFSEPEAIARLAQQLCSGTPVDVLLVAHGTLPVQASCQADLVAAREALDINGLSPVLFAEAFASRMQTRGGTIAVIGSVAGDRGRKSNYVYGAAKGLVTRYLQGMQHRFAQGPLRVVLIKPGPTDTPMTAALKASGARLAPVAEVAATIIDGIAAGKPVIYAPGKWALIMMVIRHLPRFVFNRMDI